MAAAIAAIATTAVKPIHIQGVLAAVRITADALRDGALLPLTLSICTVGAALIPDGAPI